MPVFHDSFYAMGTRLDLVIPEIRPEEGRRCADEIRSEVTRLERKLSRFDKASSLSTLNREAGARSVTVDEEMTHILRLCLSYSESTEGAFDITMSPLCTFWKERATQIHSSPPTSREIAAVKEATGIKKLEIDTENRTVRFHHPDLEIDLGGFGKGYALERVGEILERNGKKNAFVCFGDSAVLGCGRHPHGTHWEVGVKHLFDRTRSVRSFRLSNQSLSTSGTTPNNIKSAVSWYSHIISPKSGKPVVGYRTVSVVSPSALDAEVLSTALTAIPLEERDGISHVFEDLRAVEFVYSDSREPVLSWSAGLNQNH
ncbi:FAD:protein FMN transferase [Gemmatimonadota bacterium]